MPIRYYAFLLMLLFPACQMETDTNEPAFYHWKSTIDLSQTETDFLDSLHVKKLYVKYMDVDVVAGQAVPKAGLKWKGASWGQYEIIPCVFITNRSFQEGLSPEALAEKVWSYLQQANQEADIAPREYQFDCDWSPSTRSAYFAFLRSIRKRSGDALLSATIRLHQYRYPQRTGVPPVDKGSLMYYNMGDIASVSEPNSILNNETAAKYLNSTAAYDLPLDIALPLFSWVLVYRLDELHRIINWTAPEVLEEQPHFEQTGPGQYRVQRNTYFAGHYLNQGDQLRYESASQDELLQAARQLQTIKHFSGNTLYYHLDEKLLQAYSPDFLRRIHLTLRGD